MGLDRIHPTMLKELVVIIAGPLPTIYQRLWEPEEIPADWKVANIIHIYKGTREDPESNSLSV